ncbi:MAG: serine hydrolase [Pacificimonas sp.]
MTAALAGTGLTLSSCVSTPQVEPVPVDRTGVTARVAFDASGITDSYIDGIAEPGRLATADDAVRIASISKLVMTLGVLRMVEERQLDLDADVSDLLGWRLRHPTASSQPITLRLLLSHRSGLSDRGGYVIALGESLPAHIGNDSWHYAPPGERFEYANLGSAVVATVMEAASGKRFDTLMADLVFDPLGIDACYNWSGCSDETRARGIELRDPAGRLLRDDAEERLQSCRAVIRDGEPCALDDYIPGTNGSIFSPQGGLRISVNGLARIGQMLLDADDDFLSADTKASLFGSARPTNDTVICAYGLSIEALGDCDSQLFSDGRDRVGHAGEAYHLRSGLWIDRDAGTGVAYFATAVSEPAADGVSAFTPLERALARGRLLKD